MSFSVDKYGEVNSWGINKNNCLLVNNLKEGLVAEAKCELCEVSD